MDKIGCYAVPAMIALILLLAFFKKVPVFDVFLSGAKEGLCSTASILPSLVGLITAVSMLKASGLLDFFTYMISPLAHWLKIPVEVTPLMILKPISGSGSIAFLDSIFRSFGPDSFPGRVASVMMGSTETTFYAIAVYFGAVGIKNTRHTIKAALCADLAGIMMSIITVSLFFSR